MSAQEIPHKQTNKQVYNKNTAGWTEITGSQERSACRVTTIWLENGGSTPSMGWYKYCFLLHHI